MFYWLEGMSFRYTFFFITILFGSLNIIYYIYIMDKFDKWWLDKGQCISEKKYTKELELKFTNVEFVNNKVSEYYGKNSIGNKDAENNTFWYVMEEMAREDNLYLM